MILFLTFIFYRVPEGAVRALPDQIINDLIPYLQTERPYYAKLAEKHFNQFRFTQF